MDSEVPSCVSSGGEKLTFVRKLAYGAGELGPAMAGSTMIFFQMIFLTNVAGLRPGLAGSVLLVTLFLWDVVLVGGAGRIVVPGTGQCGFDLRVGCAGWVWDLGLLPDSQCDAAGRDRTR